MKTRSLFHSAFVPRAGLLVLWFLGSLPGVLRAANPPTISISGPPPTWLVDDKHAVLPFPNVTISDTDGSWVTVTIVASPADFGNFVGYTGSTNVLTLQSAGSATTAVQALVFDPTDNKVPIGTTQVITFSIWATATNAPGAISSTTNTQTTATITPINDAPTIAGASARTTTDKVSTNLFSGVTIADVDNQGTQTVTVKVLQSDAAKGTINLGLSGFTGSVGSGYTFTDTPAHATTAIRALVFQPTENRLPVGSNDVTLFTITVNDSGSPSLSATDPNTTVTATSVNDPPTISGISAAHQSVQSGGTIQPFALGLIGDVDVGDNTNRIGQLMTLQVTLSGASGNGHWVAPGVGFVTGGTTYTLPNVTQLDATAALQALAFQAQTFPLTTTNTVSFTVTVTDDHGGSANNSSAAVDVSSPFTPPGLSGTRTGQRVNDNSTLSLFSSVSVQSFNAGTFSVIVRLDNDAKGNLINLVGFTKSTSTSPASYVFNGTSEAATASIRQMLFQPTNNRINGSTNETTVFTIILVDGGVTNAPDNSTTVIVTPVNDTPTIQGISPLVTIADSDTRLPFSTVLISDADESGQQPVTVTVQLDDNAKGLFTMNSLVVSGFTSNNGSYTLSGSPVAVTTAIRQLVFAPTPHRLPVGLSELVGFAIAVDDGHGGVVANNGTSVRVAAVSGGPVVSLPSVQPVSLPITPPLQPLSLVTISDPQNLTLTLQIANLNWGVFTSNSLATYAFSNSAPGTYVFSGSASNANYALANLEFAPNTNLVLGTVITFAISVVDLSANSASGSLAITLRQTQRSLIVTKTNDYDPNDLGVPDSEKNGTLRKAVADAGSNDHITFDLRSPVPGVPDYPTGIHLKSPIALNKNVTFDGPGADLLSISGDGGGAPGVQIFQVNAFVALNRLTLTKGYHPFAGGAVEVNAGGSLTLSYCAVTDNRADVWGGGIDVDGGALELDHCLVRSNRTSAALGQGGGGISLYTDQACTIANTTFSGNQQLGPGGLGGGALYAEDFDPGIEFDVFVLRCTFRDNLDAAHHGSSIRPNVFNTTVQLQNTIVADGQGKNLELDNSGMIVSLGGNISDDSTATIFSIGGVPYDVTILDPSLGDRTSVSPALLSLANNGGPTLTYALNTNSPAIGNAVSNAPGSMSFDTLGTDQRGYWRTDNDPDAGAFERNGSRRIIIEEILFDPASPNTNNEFIEFYVPRDSTSLNLAGYQVLVHGVLCHTFTSRVLNPGEAIVLFSHDSTSTAVPTGVYSQIAGGNLRLDNNADAITLLNPSNQIVLEVSYVGSFASSDPSDPGYLGVVHQSIVLSPQFQGVYLPYQRVVAKEGGRTPGPTELSNPGFDAGGNPLGPGNAPPRAYNDFAATDVQTPLPVIPVLANDIDPDSADAIRVVGVGVTNGLTPGVTGSSGLTARGASVAINNSPTAGASVRYDPTGSAFLRSLPQGSNVVDTFQYTILDSSNGVDHVRGSTTAEISNNLAKATATVSITVTGLNLPPTPQDDSVSTSANLTTAEDTALDFTTWNTLLANDTDPNSDDNGTTLTIISVEATNAYSNSLQTLSALGAWVTLDIRFNRNQTHITYDPRGSATLNSLAVGQMADDTFYYSVKDRHGAIGTAAVHVRVTGVNDPPIARPDALATAEDTILTVPQSQLLANDGDPDTGIVSPVPPTLAITAVTATSALGASVQLVGTNVVYNPTVSATLNALARKEVVVDTFTYTVRDPQGATSNAVVSVTVTGVNDTPHALPDAYSTGEKTPLPVTAPGLLSNDHDDDVNGVPPDDTLRVVPTVNQRTAFNAFVSVNADGSFSYDPRGFFNWLGQGETTNDTFSYVLMDHSFTIANDDVFSVVGNSASNVLMVLANDALLSQTGASLSVVSVSAPNKGGTVVVNAQGNTLIYTPQANFVGVETFSYTVADGIGGTDTAQVSITVTVNPLNGRLVANADAFTVAQGTSVNLDVLANDNILPASGATFTIVSLGAPDHGGAATLSGAGPNNHVAYTPSSTPVAPFVETFAYVVSGGGSVQATGTVAVTVINRTNTLPANDDSFTVIVGGGTSSLDVLANDQILPGPNTNLAIVSIQTNGVTGTVSINAARNRLLYTPSPAIQTTTPEALFSYTISDGAGATATANVAIVVQTSGFIANDDVFSVIQNSTNNSLPVLLNDVILPNSGQTLTITDTGLGANAPNHGGTVTINGTGNRLIYVPGHNFVGEETFTYEISDGTVARAEGHVRVKVIALTPANSKPDAFAVARDSVNNALPVLKNDYLLPATLTRLTVTGLETNGVLGTVSISGNGADNLLLYSPKPGFIGRETFAYESVDALGDRGTNQVVVSVGSLLTHSDVFTVLSDSTTNPLPVLANDLLLPDTLGVRPITVLGAPDHGGAVSTDAAHSLVLYTPAAHFVGTEHFTYQIKDDSGATYTEMTTVAVLLAGSDRSTGAVTVTIIGTNDPPTITGTQTNAITDKQTTLPFAGVTIADVDQRGLQPLTVTVTLDNAAKGTLQNLGGFVNTAPGVYAMSGVGTNVTAAIRGLRFVPTENRITVPTTEAAQFTLAVNDSYVVVTDTSTTVNVTAVNDPPTIAGTVGGQRVYSHLSLRPFAGVTIGEVDNLGLQPLIITVTLAQPTFGTLSSLGGFVPSGSGVFTLSGTTAAQATTALRGLVYQPTPTNRLAAGGSETNRLTISVNDGFAPAVVDNTTTVISIDSFIKALVPSGTNASSIFGYAVAAARDLVVVGAPKDNGVATGSGAAYLFSRNLGSTEAWNQLKKLQGSDGAKDDQFGAAVAINGTTIVIGAPFNVTGGIKSGAVYVFERDQGGAGQWGQSKKLVPADGVNDDRYGTAVAISGDTLIVGSFQNKPGTPRSGAAYVYGRNQGGTGAWGLVKKLAPADGVDGDNFGISVALDADTAVVGSQFNAGLVGTKAGAAYVFDRNQGGANQWGLTKKIVPADGKANANLGHAVGISGDLVVVGAPGDNPNGLNSGSAYAFSRNQGGANQWGQVNKFVQFDAVDGDDEFGFSVTVDGELIAIGSSLDLDGGHPQGAVYVFARNFAGVTPWSLLERIAPITYNGGRDEGFACSLSQGTLAVGARINTANLSAAYIYRLKFNNPPFVAQPIPNQTGIINTPFTYVVPAGTFSDPDVGDTLTLSANLSLVAWLSFNPATATFSGIPTLAGTYPVVLTATDQDGATATASFNIAVPTSFGSFSLAKSAREVWRSDYFSEKVLTNAALEATLWGDNADPDGDGVKNLSEYLFGTDPLHANPGDRSPVSVAVGSEPGTMAITYRQRTDDWRLVYSLERSIDFVVWQTVDASVIAQETRAPVSPTVEQVTEQVQVPSAASWPQFFRVKVSILVPDLP